jgi:Flp pilus assembly protein TadB
MMAFIGLLFKFFDPIARITDKIVDLQIKKSDAKTEQERIAADERVKTLEARRDVMVAEAGVGVKLNAYIRSAIGAAVAVLLIKVMVFDKALGQWTQWRTDPLSPEIWQVVMVVIGFYFLSEIAARFKR